MLIIQYGKIFSQILDAVDGCNYTHKVPFVEAMEMFDHYPNGVVHLTNESTKCLMDCVMRRIGSVNFDRVRHRH